MTEFRTKIGNVVEFDRARPNADAIRFDDHNRPMYRYTIKYRHEDRTYESNIWAYSESDAEGRLSEIKKNGMISGQSFGRYTA